MKLSRILVNLVLALASVVIVTLILDRALILFGFPSEKPPRVVHPANYSKDFENIEFEGTFSTNSQGLRNPEIPLKRAEGEYRVLMAGDSFVQGIGVAMDETIPTYLSETLTSDSQTVQVINGGLAGTGPFAYGKLIFHLLDIYDIDAVLVTLFTNDVHTSTKSLNPKAIYPVTPKRWGVDRLVHALWPRTYILVQQVLEPKEKPEAVNTARNGKQVDVVSQLADMAAKRGIDQALIDDWQRGVRAWLDTLPPEQRDLALGGQYAWEGLTYGMSRPDYWVTGVDLDTPLANEKWEATAAIVDEIVRGIRARGKDVAVIYIPTKWQYDPNSHDPTSAVKLAGPEVRESWLSGELEIDRRLSEFARRVPVPLLNLTTSLREETAKGAVLNWQHDEHLTPAGNRIVADVIAKWLQKGKVPTGLH